MTKKITFKNLVEKISDDTGDTRTLIHDLLVETAHLTKEGLKEDGHVNLIGFGRFRLKWHKKRVGRNPMTSEIIDIPAHNTISFNPEPNFRKLINKKYSILKAVVIEDEIKIDINKNVSTNTTLEPSDEKQPSILETDNIEFQANILKSSETIVESTFIKVTETNIENTPEEISVIESASKERPEILIENTTVVSSETIIESVPDKVSETIIKNDPEETLENPSKNNPLETPETIIEAISIETPEVSETIHRDYIQTSSISKKGKLPKWIWILVALAFPILIFFIFSFQGEEKSEQVIIPLEKQLETPVAMAPIQKLAQRENTLKQYKTATNPEVYTIKSGDRLWKIAKELYGHADLWPNIYRANIEKFKSPDLLHIGKKLIIPSLEGEVGKLTEQDMQDIAEGYLEVYLAYKKIGNQKSNYFLWVVSKWNIEGVFDRYSEKIDRNDLEFINNINGSPRLINNPL